MKVLVCGWRNYTNYRKVLQALTNLPKGSIIIEGGARGADYLAKCAAKELGLEVREYRANWEAYGRRAGPVRNRLMLDEERPDVIYAFHPNLSKSKGTKHIVSMATRAGIEVEMFS